jgi:formylmethanofuran dehydrogenase subunit B
MNAAKTAAAKFATQDEDERYRIAFAKEDGEFDVVEFFSAADDAAANEYAQAAYCDQEWYVLNASGQNING